MGIWKAKALKHQEHVFAGQSRLRLHTLQRSADVGLFHAATEEAATTCDAFGNYLGIDVDKFYLISLQ